MASYGKSILELPQIVKKVEKTMQVKYLVTFRILFYLLVNYSKRGVKHI